MKSEMERRMRKTSVLRFLDNWRQYLKSEQYEKAEGFFMGAWCTQPDDWCVELQHQMTRKEKKLIMNYPIYM